MERCITKKLDERTFPYIYLEVIEHQQFFYIDTYMQYNGNNDRCQ